MEKLNKQNIIEKEYTISLREKVRSVPRYKKTNKAVRTIKEFLARHMKVYDRDLKKIKIDKYLNEHLWHRGIGNPLHKVKVKARKEGDIVKVELADLPEKLKFKKLREEKREVKAKNSEKKKPELKKSKAKAKISEESEIKEKKSDDENNDGIEDKKEESEKKSAVVEQGEKFEKAEARKQKHTTKPKTSSQDRQEKNIYKKTHA